MTSIQQHRADIIGTAHFEAFHRVGVKVTAIRSSGLAHDVAARWDIPESFTGHAFEALVNCREVDVMHANPQNRHHHAQSLTALAAGKHVVCETMSAMAMPESAEAAGRTGKVFTMNHNKPTGNAGGFVLELQPSEYP